jgi:hypothetical protein
VSMTPGYGDPVRVGSGVTGRYIDYGLALVVVSTATDLSIDYADTSRGEPDPTLPVPSDDALAGASAALLHARTKGIPTRG